MVATRSTRSNPDAVATTIPEDSPTKSSATKRSTRTSTAPEDLPAKLAAITEPLIAKSRTLTTLPPRSQPTRATRWSHTPSNLTLLWLAVSLPLVLWDTGYVLLRPHTLPGGSLHYPLWAPYKLYGTVDFVYSPEAYWSGLGFTGAQGTVNVIETAMYGVYLWIVYAYGRPRAEQGRGAPEKEKLGVLGGLAGSRRLEGREAVVAVLIGYTTFVLTFSKTVLYWLNEAFSGFSGIGHNDTFSLIFLWIIPNGAWIVLPLYLGYVFGMEIIQGLDAATGVVRKNE